MNAPRPLPSRERLLEALQYDRDAGVLRWRERPASHFGRSQDALMWNRKFAGRLAGHVNEARGYVFVSFDHRPYRAHRLIWKMVTGNEPPEIDHRNLDGTDNRWANLRLASHSENMQNSPARDRLHAHLPKGVYRNKERFMARVVCAGAYHHFGTFDTIEEAHAAYLAGAVRIHGEFANTDPASRARARGRGERVGA